MLGLARLSWAARRSGVAVVHGTEKPRDVLYGFVVARLAGAASITHLHVKVESWIDAKARWVMHRNDALIGVSRFVADSAVEMGYDRHRVHAVLNGLEPAKWQRPVTPIDLHAEFAVPPHVPIVAIIARIFPWKGHEQLIRALAEVRRRGVGFHLLVVGEDDPRATPGGGSYTAALRAIVEELALEDAVTFTGFRSDIPEIMSAIDVFAMPSHEEPYGMVYTEALAMGTAVVASRSGGVPEFIEHGVTGLLATPGDVDELARMLERLLVDPVERERLASAGRAMVWTSGSATRMAADVAAVYDIARRRA
jgi:glycosyltransferase involved in cell wall biosynthesis